MILPFPPYQSLYEVAGPRAASSPLAPASGEDGWYCDLDELERLITPKTRLLVLNTPINPTGWRPVRRRAAAHLRVGFAATACASWPMRSTA